MAITDIRILNGRLQYRHEGHGWLHVRVEAGDGMNPVTETKATVPAPPHFLALRSMPENVYIFINPGGRFNGWAFMKNGDHLVSLYRLDEMSERDILGPSGKTTGDFLIG